jgi:alkanesulfonate monooxygenase SsuD/methylene tetrahydromethanopterin reductase-like flavin-dependent oxidoreductase (luciferase family)
MNTTSFGIMTAFDFDGTYHHLTGAFCNPKPVQQPQPPIVIGGRSTPTLRVVAQHADVWNIPGGDIDDAIRRSAVLDRQSWVRLGAKRLADRQIGARSTRGQSGRRPVGEPDRARTGADRDGHPVGGRVLGAIW